MPTTEFRCTVAAPASEVFAWHCRPGAFERLAPPWAALRVVECQGSIESRRIVFVMKVGVFSVRWVAQHQDFIPGRQFRDVQVEGPFKRWTHTHTVEPRTQDTCELIDHVEYEPPLGAAGALLSAGLIQSELTRLFAYRHCVMCDDLAAHRRAPAEPLRIGVTGSSGLIGRNLVAFLGGGGQELIRLIRQAPRGADEAQWDPATGFADPSSVEGLDAVVHLAAENIGAVRWTPARKAKARDSRVGGTATLSRALAQLAKPPRVLVTASGTGIYGDRGEQVLTESSSPGRGFLADVCRAWEAATAPAERVGIRVAHARMGIVLTPAGGALRRMLPMFRRGFGGRMGSGKQFWSWVAMDDVVHGLHEMIVNPALRGPVNLVTPGAVRNSEFTRTLGLVLRRPAHCPVPAPLLRLCVGGIAAEAILASAAVRPARLLEAGFAYAFPDLESALRHLLGCTRR